MKWIGVFALATIFFAQEGVGQEREKGLSAEELADGWELLFGKGLFFYDKLKIEF